MDTGLAQPSLVPGWWRKHQMEARSSTVVSALMAGETRQLTIGWGIISPWTRHRCASRDGRARRPGGGGAGPVPLLRVQDIEDLSSTRWEQGRRRRSSSAGRRREYAAWVRGGVLLRAETRGAPTCPRSPPRRTRRAAFRRSTWPRQRRRCNSPARRKKYLTPSITTPAFVRYTRDNVAADIDIGCTVVASIAREIRPRWRDGAREIAAVCLANKVQNIAGAADTLGTRNRRVEIRPVAEAMEQGGRLGKRKQRSPMRSSTSAEVRQKPLRSTSASAIEEYRNREQLMLKLSGKDRTTRMPVFGGRCCHTPQLMATI